MATAETSIPDSSAQNGLRYIPRDSVLHRVYPLVKLAWVFVVAIGLFFYRTPLSGAVMLASVLALVTLVGRIPLRVILSSSRVIFGLGILLMFFHLFADKGTVIYRLGLLGITDTGLNNGPVFFFRLSVVVLASFTLIWTTDSRDLMVSLAKAGISYRYAFAVFLALRFLPIVQREVEAVNAAHLIRGRSAKSGLGHRIRLWQRYVFTVLVNGLRKAETTAAALDCRAFGAYPDRTYVKDVEYHPSGLILIAVFVAINAVLVLLKK